MSRWSYLLASYLFLAPLTSHKICSKVIEMGKFETPYVVMIHSGQIISSNNASKLTGATSMKSAMINEQVSYGSDWSSMFNLMLLTFKIPRASVCHGLAGYFRARLYGDVLIKTHPESKMSREMLSWFPIFFPLKLIGGDDINPEDYDSVERAWSRYIESYSDMSIERTIGLDGIKVKEPFLKRYSTIFY
ncbi:PRMT5 arginine-N-methyltransferase-domain-containing protein [Phakopsora pachyrhizi]|nr:PRMT5 arginine-N-methyltransferase-domain-containing protein [Phakopsora pachyrhizi]